MISYSWRVSCFWPYLNLCAWTPLFLSRAQPIVSSTTGRKWTLAPWNGTGVKSLISCILFWGKPNRKTVLFRFLFEIAPFKMVNSQWNKITLKVSHFAVFDTTDVSRGIQELHWTGSRSCPICLCHRSYDCTTTCRRGRSGNPLLL